jgi:hypothetical protein
MAAAATAVAISASAAFLLVFIGTIFRFACWLTPGSPATRACDAGQNGFLTVMDSTPLVEVPLVLAVLFDAHLTSTPTAAQS